MNIFIRRIILILFLLGFFIASPILIFYSSGYRYDFSKNKIVKTGSFYFSSIPAVAEIYLNNEDQQKKTPNRILYLLPNEYRIKIEKEGYFPWEKQLKIESRQTTFANAIRLFPKNEPKMLLPGNIDMFKLSPDKKNVLYSIKDEFWQELWLLNLKSNEKTLLYRATADSLLEFLSFSPGGNKILISKTTDNAKNYFVVELASPYKIIDLDSLVSQNNSYNPSWDVKDENIIFSQSKNAIYLIDLNKDQDATKILDLKTEFVLQNYSPKQKSFYVVKSDDQNSYLEKFEWDFASQKTQKSENILKLNRADYLFLDCYNQRVCLLNNSTKELYIIDQDLKNIVMTAKDVSHIEWKNSNFITYNDYEIWIHSLLTGQENKQSDLLTRYGAMISKAEILPNDDYVAFLIENQLKIIEMDKRDKQNVVEYQKFDKISDFYIVNEGNDIIFSGSNGDKGIYIINISEFAK